jgi:pyrimidine-nucleoside phosphorylase
VTYAQSDFQGLVRAFAVGDANDDAMERWLRAVFEKGLTLDETFALTTAMAHSGEVIDWSGARETIVDKHSTGGVGDAVTLIAVPTAAACGVKVAKLSGRALGHTGGTLDKLECIPGLRTDLSVQEFQSIVMRVGCAVAAASDRLAPADKKMYALRHKTGLIASIPLIASSVMSKKLAAGARAIVLDVKYGGGAFIQSKDDAQALADTMRAIGERAGKSMTTLLTKMEEPLADSAGDALELDEALSIMEGRDGSEQLRRDALLVAEAMVRAGGFDGDSAARALHDGSALAKFREMTTAQGGTLESFERSWPGGDELTARSSGRVARIDARRIGEAIADAKSGAARSAAMRFGVRLRRRVGDSVREGDRILTSWLPQRDRRLEEAIVIALDDRAGA